MKATLDPIYVDIYLRCRANPAFHIPGPREVTHAFVVDMERRLSALPTLSQQVLLLLAQGYTKAEISRRTLASPRAVTQHVRHILWDGPDAVYKNACNPSIPELSVAAIKRTRKREAHSGKQVAMAFKRNLDG